MSNEKKKTKDVRQLKISFMVAGVQKAGTTSMYEYLCQHPDVGMPRRKEPHYFDRDDADWSAPNYEKLHRLYEPGRAVYGESTPVTLYWTAAHERVRAYNPAMQFILLFRDPVDRAYSHWCMQYARGNETLSFSEAIRDGRHRISDEPKRFSYVERGFYGRQMVTLRRVFPENRILFLMSEDLLTRRVSTLAKVAEFIEIDPERFESKEPVIARKRKSVRYPSILTDVDRAYLQDLYADDMKLFAQTTNLDIGRWLLKGRPVSREAMPVEP